MADPRDAVLQTGTPTVMVPRFGEFEPLTEPGHRFLAATDGLWLELRRAWLYLRLPLARQTVVAMPYGTVTPTIDLAFGSIPRQFVEAFVGRAREHLPNEHAAWVTWSQDSGKFKLRFLEETEASPEHLNVNRPVLDDGEHLVLDLHSHGYSPAFFSSKDNGDDRGEVKIAGVVGSLGTAAPSSRFRLCGLGLFVPLSGPATAEGVLA